MGYKIGKTVDGILFWPIVWCVCVRNPPQTHSAYTPPTKPKLFHWKVWVFNFLTRKRFEDMHHNSKVARMLIYYSVNGVYLLSFSATFFNSFLTRGLSTTTQSQIVNLPFWWVYNSGFHSAHHNSPTTAKQTAHNDTMNEKYYRNKRLDGVFFCR